MALVCLAWLCGVGMIDDWLKLTAAQRGTGRQGLTSLEKLLFQIGLGVLLSYFTYQYGQETPHELYFPFLKDVQLPLTLGAFVLIGTIVLTGSSNAVNLTDGLDGLAAGTMAIVSFAFFILAMIVGQPGLGIVPAHAARAGLRPDGGPRRRHDRSLPGVPLVQLQPRPRLHGRHRLAGAGRADRLHRPGHPPGTDALHDRRHLRHRGALGDHPGRRTSSTPAASTAKAGESS